MNNTPLVSVITPSYNHGKFITQSIESVANQTYQNIEYFIIDDGSTDNSVDIIKSLRAKYNFNFETQQNKGLAQTMNKLIAKCKGKYIALIESDDVWLTDKIEKQVSFLEKNTGVMVCAGNALSINEKNEILPGKQRLHKQRREYNLHDIISFNYHIASPTVIMRREAFDLIGVYDERLLYIDLYNWLKITLNNYPIVILPDVLAYYRIHETNVHYDSYKMYLTLKQSLIPFEGDPLYPKLERNAMTFIFPYLALNNKREAITILPKAFKLNWRSFKGLITLLIPFSLIKVLTKTRYR